MQVVIIVERCGTAWLGAPWSPFLVGSQSGDHWGVRELKLVVGVFQRALGTIIWSKNN